MYLIAELFDHHEGCEYRKDLPASATHEGERAANVAIIKKIEGTLPLITKRTQALAAVRGMLAPEGLVGVVQHRLPESAPAEGADGSRGYMKQSDVIAIFEEAGFELLASSEINANPKDRPGPEDVVWRLPPNLQGSKDDPEKRAAMEAIGESDRMTLLFRKAR